MLNKCAPFPWGLAAGGLPAALLPAPPARSSLLTGLALSLTFEDGANLGLDSSGTGNDLTNNNGVTRAAGNAAAGTHAANFAAASSQSLSLASNASLVLSGTSWEMTAWVKYASYPGSNFPGIAGKWGAAGGLEYLLYYSANDTKIHAVASLDGVTGFELTTLRPAVGAWMFLDVWFDAATSFMHANADGAAFTDGGAVNGGGGTVNGGANAFVVGSTAFGAPFMDGAVDAVNLWRRLLTPAERTALYNAGAGLEYPFS